MKGDTIFGWIIFLGMILLVAAICRPERCMERHKIVTVGGCDFHGDCTVLLDDGTSVDTSKAVVGGLVCTKCQTVFWWDQHD